MAEEKKAEIPPDFDMNAKWNACLDLGIRRFVYSSFSGAFAGLLLFLPGTIKFDTYCGIGGKYHYDSNRFCGSLEVPVCSNPSEYMFWDGIHFTQETYHLVETILFAPAIVELNCTTTTTTTTIKCSFNMKK